MLKANFEGYNLIEYSKDEWYLQVIGQVAYKGTFRQAIIFAISKLGFKIEELDMAINIMLQEDHNIAHFGMYRGFMYSHRQDFSKRKVA